MDEKEFEDFYEQTRESLWRYIMNVTRDAELSRDMVQVAFLRYWRNPPRWGEPRQKRAYLFRIATNMVYDHGRALKREIQFLSRWQKFLEGNSSIQEPSPELWECMNHLNRKDRMLLWLAYYEGMEHKEIAEIISVKESSIPVMLFRARKRLAKVLEKFGYRSERHHVS